MAKVFITDEVNDNYTANVTSGGSLVTASEGYSFTTVTANAAASTSTWLINSACYLHSLIITSLPATATVLTLVNASATGETTSTGGTGRICRIDIPAASCATSVGAVGLSYIFDMYISKGITFYASAGDLASASVVAVYRTS